MRQIKYIVLHCTGASSKQSVSSILNYWKSPKPKGLGWVSMGYHHLIEANGLIHDLADIQHIASGVKGYNVNSLHISYIGGLNGKDTRTTKQRAAMEQLVHRYHGLYPAAKIKGHRDFSPDKNKNGVLEPSEWIKQCPAFDVASWLKEIGL